MRVSLYPWGSLVTSDFICIRIKVEQVTNFPVRIECRGQISEDFQIIDNDLEIIENNSCYVSSVILSGCVQGFTSGFRPQPGDVKM